MGQQLPRFTFCPKCGGVLKGFWDSNIPRSACVDCGYVFYENPVVGVAGIVLNGEQQILLGRRCRGQYSGYWCIPCGYVEYHEEVHEALQREFKEETNLDIEVLNPFTAQSNFHDPDRHSVGIWFWARIIDGSLSPGDDLDELDYFDLDDLPDLAFPTDRKVLEMLHKYVATEIIRWKASP